MGTCLKVRYLINYQNRDSFFLTVCSTCNATRRQRRSSVAPRSWTNRSVPSARSTRFRRRSAAQSSRASTTTASAICSALWRWRLRKATRRNRSFSSTRSSRHTSLWCSLCYWWYASLIGRSEYFIIAYTQGDLVQARLTLKLMEREHSLQSSAATLPYEVGSNTLIVIDRWKLFYFNIFFLSLYLCV